MNPAVVQLEAIRGHSQQNQLIGKGTAESNGLLDKCEETRFRIDEVVGWKNDDGGLRITLSYIGERKEDARGRSLMQ